MSKQDIFEFFFRANESLTARNILLILGASLCVSAVIFLTYRLTHTGTAYSVKLNATNVAIELITTVIMMMISSNIVISLGMVGALSIIRFRTAVKDPWDTVYIFWAVVEGLSVGSQNFKLAVLSALFIAAVLILLSFHVSLLRKYLLVVRTETEFELPALEQTVRRYHRSLRLRAANQTADNREYIYELSVRKALNAALLDSVRALPGVKSVNFLEQNGDTVG